ncbi:putative UDP-glucuronosyltransferase 2A3 [Calycina marina]|uniref:UDP-glucuronosyltransferase 2A3 n=1 Tax=Calycina marina TaxID=1763456 RepID=A0A9P7YV94_9HELO|nr:putative UDP-glucuronosyltransferase 2A3 [Calycina marina]
MASSKKPLLLVSSTPVYGHFMPIKGIAKELLSRGYEITFVTGSPYRQQLEDMGCSFVSLEGDGDQTEKDINNYPERKGLTGVEGFIFDMINFFIKWIPSQHEAQQKALQKLTSEHPGRPIIAINEGFFLGAIPALLNAPGFKADASINIGIVPITLSSIDTAPFGSGLPPNSTPEGRIANAAASEDFQQVIAPITNAFRETIKQCGAKHQVAGFFDATFLHPDCFLQMCIPSVEYPRSDAPSHIKFAGGLPKGNRPPYADAPVWWATDILANETKKIVLVSQGTIAMNPNELMVPTMLGLASYPDFLVVVALGVKGATLPEGTVIPENARVADYIPFDELLPHCSAFVTNGGYGAFQHSVSNGIPLVLAGATEDKPEVSARAEWAGIGINMKTASPSAEAIAEAVKTIVSDGKFKRRALELQSEMKEHDPMSIIAATIEELAAGLSKKAIDLRSDFYQNVL